MSYSQIGWAVVSGGTLTVSGRIDEREGLEEKTWSLRVVIVQGQEVVAADGALWPANGWIAAVESGYLRAGEPAQALAVVTRVYVNNDNASPLVTETINWSETITLMSEFPAGVDRSTIP
jgi:hypothetical protein